MPFLANEFALADSQAVSHVGPSGRVEKDPDVVPAPPPPHVAPGQVARPELLLRTFTRASRRIRLLLVFLTAVTLTNVVFGAREALVGAANAPGVVLPVIAWVLLVFLASFALLWLWVLRE